MNIQTEMIALSRVNWTASSMQAIAFLFKVISSGSAYNGRYSFPVRPESVRVSKIGRGRRGGRGPAARARAPAARRMRRQAMTRKWRRRLTFTHTHTREPCAAPSLSLSLSPSPPLLRDFDAPSIFAITFFIWQLLRSVLQYFHLYR